MALRRQRPGLRRWLSAGVACVAVAGGLKVLAPAPPRHQPVLVAAHDLAAGHRLQADDLRVAAWSPGSAPDGSLTSAASAVGRVSAGPLRRGTPITDSDLLGPGLLAGQPPDLLAVPVVVSSGSLTGLVGRGDRVDVLAAADSAVLVTDAVVLADPAAATAPSADAGGLGLGGSPAAADGAGSGLGGQSLVLGVRIGEAGRLAHAEAVGALTIAVHPR